LGSFALPELTPLRSLAPFLGSRIIKFVKELGAFIMYGKESFVLVFRRPYRPRLIFQQMEFIGNESLFIIMISGFFLGAVFSLQIGSIFAIFGAQGMIGAASGKALTRELSPLVTGFLLAGRGGAAITAELATMKVSEQIDAMEAMAVDPVHYLVVPRLIASLLMLPLLVGVFNFTGQLGSLVVSIFMFDVDQGVYFDKLIRIVEIGDIWRGMHKAVVFGGIIALLSCRSGLTASGGAKGVGTATTNSVVLTLLVLLAVDFIITYFQVVV
jgi:phospholipid/cholesterol/gamma-HCH transport system permease protein